MTLVGPSDMADGHPTPAPGRRSPPLSWGPEMGTTQSLFVVDLVDREFIDSSSLGVYARGGMAAGA